MNTGMLWFDNSKETLSSKIKKAMEYYQKKFQRTPDLCFVNPNMLQNEKLDESMITVRPYRPVLPGHIWIGIEDKKAK